MNKQLCKRQRNIHLFFRNLAKQLHHINDYFLSLNKLHIEQKQTLNDYNKTETISNNFNELKFNIYSFINFTFSFNWYKSIYAIQYLELNNYMLNINHKVYYYNKIFHSLNDLTFLSIKRILNIMKRE